MFAIDLITDAIAPAHTSDSIQKVLDRMIEFRIRHLPIVNEEQFLGLISENDFITESDYQTPIGTLALTLVNPCSWTISIYTMLSGCFSESQLTVVPVLDAKKNYLGLISINAIAKYFANLTSVAQPGGIIVLEISDKNNSLAHMSQIVESDNAQIFKLLCKQLPRFNPHGGDP